MGGTEILLILVLVACVGALFAIYFRKKQLDEAPGEQPGPESFVPESPPVPPYSPAPPIPGDVFIPPTATPGPEPEPVPAALPADMPPLPEPIPTPPVSEQPPPEPGPEQHTIYAFERVAQVYVCPKCDGENGINRPVCCICGYEFRKGVRWL